MTPRLRKISGSAQSEHKTVLAFEIVLCGAELGHFQAYFTRSNASYTNIHLYFTGALSSLLSNECFSGKIPKDFNLIVTLWCSSICFFIPLWFVFVVVFILDFFFFSNGLKILEITFC